MSEKNKRLIQNGDIIYPFTKQENVIGLQKTIKEKLPVVASTAPTNFVERQVWIDTTENDENPNDEIVLMAVPKIESTLIFEDRALNISSGEENRFYNDENNDTLYFGEENSEENLIFEKEEI